MIQIWILPSGAWNMPGTVPNAPPTTATHRTLTATLGAGIEKRILKHRKPQLEAAGEGLKAWQCSPAESMVSTTLLQSPRDDKADQKPAGWAADKGSAFEESQGRRSGQGATTSRSGVEWQASDQWLEGDAELDYEELSGGHRRQEEEQEHQQWGRKEQDAWGPRKAAWSGKAEGWHAGQTRWQKRAGTGFSRALDATRVMRWLLLVTENQRRGVMEITLSRCPLTKKAPKGSENQRFILLFHSTDRSRELARILKFLAKITVTEMKTTTLFNLPLMQKSTCQKTEPIANSADPRRYRWRKGPKKKVFHFTALGNNTACKK